mmetsp:Transcript_670/g.563  ORF Transcript_670/g.563 Transcript_670/m.563 type:complete len:352 (+) Transcript_670:2-1057(+)
MFNMTATLITNCHQVTDQICSGINYFVNAISEYNTLQIENAEKFFQYFGDKECCVQFKKDFLQIDDYDKNDALYLDSGENVNNQYFVCLKIKQASEDPIMAVNALAEKYEEEELAKVLAHLRLTRLLKLKVKNFTLKRRSKVALAQARDLGVNEYSWISLLEYGNIVELKEQSLAHDDIFETIEELYDLQNQLFNIFSNHYTIRHSFDTHFVTSKLNQIEQIVKDARKEISKKIYEIQKTENDKNDESFNPFIEIGEDNKEVKFVSLEEKDEKIQKAITEISANLRSKEEEIRVVMNNWLNSMPEPETLEIGAKQASLQKKLKWERMISSQDKINKLQGMFKKLRSKRNKK